MNINHNIANNADHTSIEAVVMLVRAGIALTTPQAAIYLNLSPRTLEKYRRIGGGPTYAIYGNRVVRYSIASLDAWKNARIRNSTSEGFV